MKRIIFIYTDTFLYFFYFLFFFFFLDASVASVAVTSFASFATFATFATVVIDDGTLGVRSTFSPVLKTRGV